MSFDITHIKQENPIAEVIGRSLELKRSGREFVALCPFHGEKTPSFTVTPEKGFFKCFGCGAQGDVIDFTRRMHNVDLRRACEMLGAQEAAAPVGKLAPSPVAEALWQPVMPVPGDAPPPPAAHFRLGTPNHTFDVRNQDGELLHLICRWEPSETNPKKTIRPLSFDGTAWVWKGPAAPRPLYGLPLTGLPILLVEGEKKRDIAATVLCDDYDVVSWANGKEGVAYAAWAQLHGHDVVLWPDADQPGAEAAQNVAAALLGHVRQLRIVSPPPAVPAGWDVADAINEKWTRETLLNLIGTAELLRDPNSEPPEPDPDDPGPQAPDPADEPEHAPRRSRRREGGAIAWGEPVDFLGDDKLGTPDLQPHHIPDALWPFVKDVSVRMGVDPAGVALGALVCCASTISEQWKLQPRRHDYGWKESARLWGAILGGPSTIKSPQIAACSRPIERLEAESRQRHAEEKRVYKAALEEHKRAIKAKEPSEEPRMPRMDRFMVEGTTIEALQEVLRDDDEAKNHAPSGKVLSRWDEMSEFFANLDRFKGSGGGGGDRGAYLRLYNGGTHTIDRVGRGHFSISSWSACLLGGCQPGPIQRIARESVDDGLLQRFLWCVPTHQGIGVDQRPDHVAEKRYEALFPALVASQPSPDISTGHIRSVVLHQDGHAIREEVEAVARAMASMPDASPRLQSTFGKWGGQFARLVLTFHMINIADARCQGQQPPPAGVVPVETIQRAADYLTEIVLPHLLLADAMMFSTNQTGHARWVAGLILATELTRITTRDVTRAYGALRAPESARDLMDVMASLVAVGWLEPEESNNPAKPTHAWTVNPAVHTAFKARAEKERTIRQQAKEASAKDMSTLSKKRKAKESP